MEEPLIFSPYNPVNREITEKEVMGILKHYGLPIQTIYNMELFKRAFIHKSYVKRSQQENEQNNIIISECPIDSIPLKTKSSIDVLSCPSIFCSGVPGVAVLNILFISF